MNTFTWKNFSNEFIKKVVYNEKTAAEAVPTNDIDDIDLLLPSMSIIAETPTRDFVTTYRTEIEFSFLRHYPKLVLGITGAPKKANPLSELNYISQQPMTNSLADQYIKALLEVGGGVFIAEEYSLFSHKRIVDLQSTVQTDIPLYDFQKDAISALKHHFVENSNRAGFLVMPTGSGKTRTAVSFLLNHMIADGYQVVWLTHRHMLIDQTAAAFYDHVGSIKAYNKDKKQFKMVCVSGHHQTIKATEKDDDLMIMSVQSTCRSLDYLNTVLSKKVVIVVDEAHHTVAKSYRKTINHIMKKCKNALLLGLTATPIRGTDIESSYLMRLFDSNIIYSVSMAELIKKGVLAEPVFEHIHTGENFEQIITIDEGRHIKRFGELPTSLVDRIAKSSERNGLIVKQYLDNKVRYGKTIVFALNGFHAFTLSVEFKKHNVKCGFLYSNHSKEDNAKVIRAFKNDDIDVLININILTEGSDIPDIQTVFLTRPTSSDVLLLQMIGRGMRGKQAGGTKEAFIVDFCDKWETFNRWLNPEWLISGQNMDVIDDIEPKKRNPSTLVPYDKIKDIYDSIAFAGGRLDATVSIPYGWYSILSEGEDLPLIVFKDQYSCYEKLFNDRDTLAKSGTPSVNALRKLYFGGFVTPPTNADLAMFWDNIKDKQEKPDFFVFEDREHVDPYHVAQKIMDEKLYLYDYTKEVFEKNPIAQGIFSTLTRYNDVVSDIINYELNSPDKANVMEFPIEYTTLTLDNPYDIQTLTKEVIDEMFEGSFTGLESIEWADPKDLRGYYGMCWNMGGEIFIKINGMLNSSQTDKEVAKYIIYHELLHRDFRYHDKTFKEHEHKYPNYTELERVLDYKYGQYKFEM